MGQGPEYFISCDWGTTNFRIRLVRTDSCRIIDSYVSNEGIKSLNDLWESENENQRSQLFTEFLIEKIHVLDPDGLAKNVVASGMVSSNIGLQELAYAHFPFDFDGGQLQSVILDKVGDFSILLISGVQNQSGMMRGEETQATGLSEHIDPESEGVLILPGTHSKHIRFSDGVFTSSRNFITGEMFSLLTSYSILANSVRESSFEGSSVVTFKEGVSEGYKHRVSSLLFSVRAQQVLHGSSPESNYYYLSGLLIGDELSFVSPNEGKIIIAPPTQLYKLYKTAFEVLFDSSAYTVLDSEVLDVALLKGQKKILLKNSK